MRGKRVLVRGGFNVPVNSRGEITDDSRLRASLPTIRWLIDRKAKVILISHLGRPDGKRVPRLSMEAVGERLSELLDRQVRTLGDCVGPTVEQAVATLKSGQVALLENLRFHPEEEENDAHFARHLARLADLYVDDAFENIHRRHASMSAITQYLPSVAGFLVEREVTTLSRVLSKPRRPFVTIIGGAKISTKLVLIRKLLPKVDYLLLGGALANTMLKAHGIQVGKSLIEPAMVAAIRRLRLTDPKLKIPVDVIVASEPTAEARTFRRAVGNVRPDELILDIGPDTVALFNAIIAKARTVVWNGTVGLAELPSFAKGTRAVTRALAKAKATTIVGGGETVDAVRKLGLTKRLTLISSGGGAMLEFLEGKPLPGLVPLLAGRKRG